MIDNSLSLEDRLFRKVKKGECWEWLGALSRSGYGVLTYKNVQFKVHRLIWTLRRGPISKGLCVCHKCDNRRCVKPDHLFLGTIRENILDMWRKGRGAKGEQNGQRVLSWEIVRAIRNIRHEVSQSEIARRYGINRSTVRYALKYGWK